MMTGPQAGNDDWGLIPGPSPRLGCGPGTKSEEKQKERKVVWRRKR